VRWRSAASATRWRNPRRSLARRRTPGVRRRANGAAGSPYVPHVRPRTDPSIGPSRARAAARETAVPRAAPPVAPP